MQDQKKKKPATETFGVKEVVLVIGGGKKSE